MVENFRGFSGKVAYGFEATVMPVAVAVAFFGVAGCPGPDCPGKALDDGRGRRVVCLETGTETDGTSTTTTSGTGPGSTSVMSTTTTLTTTTTGEMTDSDSGTMTTGGGVCGDGVVDEGEDCDEGNTMNSDEGACTLECKENVCGDGKVHGNVEECDEGEGNSDAGVCTSGCKNNVCGDGNLYVGVEACDDGNVDGDDGCSAVCVVEELRVFVTSGTFTGALGGLVEADNQCVKLAMAAKLPGVYMAWLSDGMMSPATRFGLGEGYSGWFVLVNGEVVAEGWGDLVDGDLKVAIDVDERGVGMVKDTVWTNTSTDGLSASSHCNSWSSEEGADKGAQGDATKSGGAWTSDPNNQSVSCNQMVRLYCFQVKQSKG
jgi:cysteine-rich repeat protein